jgi:hypothetical protein
MREAANSMASGRPSIRLILAFFCQRLSLAAACSSKAFLSFTEI